MRLLSVVWAMMLVSSAAAAAHPASVPPKPADCPTIGRLEAAQRDGKATFRKLGELPPADAYKAVLRYDGRCETPLILRYNVGAPKR